MQPEFFDNRTRIVKDGLVKAIGKGDRVSVAAALFSIYGYGEAQKAVEQLRLLSLYLYRANLSYKTGCKGAA